MAKVFGETSSGLVILNFRGTKRINLFEASPFECGQRFVSLTGVHHRQYRGNAFYMRKRQPVKVPVNNRIMIDRVFFHEANPNYTWLCINESAKQNLSDGAWMIIGIDDRSTNQSDQVKSIGKDLGDG